MANDIEIIPPSLRGEIIEHDYDSDDFREFIESMRSARKKVARWRSVNLNDYQGAMQLITAARAELDRWESYAKRAHRKGHQ